MSYVLFRLRFSHKVEDPGGQTDSLLKQLRGALPDLDGDLHQASDFMPDLEGGVLLRVPPSHRFSAARRVRSVLKGKGLAFDEGVIEPRMTGGGLQHSRENASRSFEAGKAFSHLGMLDEASLELRRAIETDSTFTEAYHYLVAILRQQGRSEEALSLLQDSARFQEEDASFQFLFARLLSELGRKDQAVEKLKASIRLNPKTSEPYVQLGKIFQEQGDFEASELSYLQALSHGPRSPEASLGLGSIALSRGDFDSAEDHLLDALDLNEGLHEARLLLGWTYFKDGRYDQAEVEFLQVAYGSQSQFHLSALFSLAQLYLERGNPTMVLEVMDRADDKLFEVPEACRVLGDAYYLTGQNVEALQAWDRGFAVGLIESSELSLRRAVALSRVGELEEAEMVLSRLELRDGATTAVLEMRASLRMANEQWEEAYAILHEARRCDPNSAMIAFQMGWVAENLGLVEASEKDYKSALRLDPTLHEAYSGLGWLYYQRECYREALVLFEEALALQPNNPEMLEQVGWVQLLLKEDLAALATLDLAIRLEPDAPLLRAYRACALLRLGEHAEARLEVQAALADPDDEMVEALGHYLNALLFLEEGDDYQASVELERSLESQELPPEVVQLTLQGPLKEKGSKAWSEARRRRQGDIDDKGVGAGSGL
jgi:tetratricopeptide (TPR) repeat protein